MDPFASLELTPYQTAPQLPLQTLVVLSNALSSRMPDDPPAYIAAAELAMREVVDESEQAMVIRLRQTNEVSVSADLELDNAIDGLWSLLRDRLRGWARYERPGLNVLMEDDDLVVDFEAVRAKATRAGELSVRLFGEGSLEMLSRSYPEQSQLMANLLELIESDDLADDLLDLGGEELLPIIQRCQALYESMVDRRSGKDTTSRADLRVLRSKLQRRIVRYSTLVLTMLDESKPATRELVEAALQPMITLRPQRSGAGAGDGDEAEDEEGAEVAAGDDAPVDG
ncbi:hypothetical protein DB30_01231 [Enhygromyxa salina]|uniref:Uncharacterized protein n=2 Tax=Enhygromyxa salina TaxID=215803 RepID=A0A0C1ZNA4_9BACT|nr:hypothetical protein DB30_01231 [Enhygromyxa salina]